MLGVELLVETFLASYHHLEKVSESRESGGYLGFITTFGETDSYHNIRAGVIKREYHTPIEVSGSVQGSVVDVSELSVGNVLQPARIDIRS